MAKKSFWWRRILFQIHNLLTTKLKSRVFPAFSRHRLRRTGKWLLGLIGIIAMLVWNWKLLLATITGAGLMLLVYQIQAVNWQVYWSHWQPYFTGSNRKFTLAVGSGGIAALGTYMAASIWVEFENRWLATGTILQGLATLITLGLLLWQMSARRVNQDEAKFEQLLSDLTDTNPLKRLIAVRKLTHLVNKTHHNSAYLHQLLEYFRLMLSIEKEPIVREAVLESLKLWDRSQPLIQNHQPLQIPIDFQKSSQRVYRRI